MRSCEVMLGRDGGHVRSVRGQQGVSKGSREVRQEKLCAYVKDRRVAQSQGGIKWCTSGFMWGSSGVMWGS